MLERNKDYHGWLYLIIPLMLLSLFTFYPLIRTFLISFDTAYDDANHVLHYQLGFKHFTDLFSVGSTFKQNLINTMVVVFISVPVSTILALAIAVGLNSIKPLQKIFQTIFFMPYVTNTIAIGMVFAVMFNKDFGLANTLLNWFGINPINWINLNTGDGMNSTYMSKMFVIQFYIIWSALPFKILIFIGGLQNIGKQYYDAAKIDSTSRGRVLRKITIPLLSPIIAYILITSFIGAFKTYDAVVGLFGSGSEHAEVQTIVWFIYQQIDFINGGVYGRGAAAAVILFGIIMVFTGINLWVSNKKVHY